MIRSSMKRTTFASVFGTEASDEVASGSSIFGPEWVCVTAMRMFFSAILARALIPARHRATDTFDR
jgi:hypothetical protein